VGGVHGGGAGRRRAPGLRRGELAVQPLGGRPRHLIAAAQSFELTTRLEEADPDSYGHENDGSADAHSDAHTDADPHAHDPNTNPLDQALAAAVSITLDVYSHVIPAMQEKVVKIAELVPTARWCQSSLPPVANAARAH
jgi:hypothetical protein